MHSCELFGVSNSASCGNSPPLLTREPSFFVNDIEIVVSDLVDRVSRRALTNEDSMGTITEREKILKELDDSSNDVQFIANIPPSRETSANKSTSLSQPNMNRFCNAEINKKSMGTLKMTPEASPNPLLYRPYSSSSANWMAMSDDAIADGESFRDQPSHQFTLSAAPGSQSTCVAAIDLNRRRTTQMRNVPNYVAQQYQGAENSLKEPTIPVNSSGSAKQVESRVKAIRDSIDLNPSPVFPRKQSSGNFNFDSNFSFPINTDWNNLRESATGSASRPFLKDSISYRVPSWNSRSPANPIPSKAGDMDGRSAVSALEGAQPPDNYARDRKKAPKSPIETSNMGNALLTLPSASQSIVTARENFGASLARQGPPVDGTSALTESVIDKEFVLPILKPTGNNSKTQRPIQFAPRAQSTPKRGSSVAAKDSRVISNVEKRHSAGRGILSVPAHRMMISAADSHASAIAKRTQSIGPRPSNRVAKDGSMNGLTKCCKEMAVEIAELKKHQIETETRYERLLLESNRRSQELVSMLEEILRHQNKGLSQQSDLVAGSSRIEPVKTVKSSGRGVLRSSPLPVSSTASFVPSPSFVSPISSGLALPTITPLVFRNGSALPPRVDHSPDSQSANTDSQLLLASDSRNIHGHTTDLTAGGLLSLATSVVKVRDEFCSLGERRKKVSTVSSARSSSVNPSDTTSSGPGASILDALDMASKLNSGSLLMESSSTPDLGPMVRIDPDTPHHHVSCTISNCLECMNTRRWQEFNSVRKNRKKVTFGGTSEHRSSSSMMPSRYEKSLSIDSEEAASDISVASSNDSGMIHSSTPVARMKQKNIGAIKRSRSVAACRKKRNNKPGPPAKRQTPSDGLRSSVDPSLAASTEQKKGRLSKPKRLSDASIIETASSNGTESTGLEGGDIYSNRVPIVPTTVCPSADAPAPSPRPLSLLPSPNSAHSAAIYHNRTFFNGCYSTDAELIRTYNLRLGVLIPFIHPDLDVTLYYTPPLLELTNDITDES